MDGLRTLAMIGVLYVHFWNDRPVAEFVRVSLFFTISGFLITHMLYRAKVSGVALLPVNFYIRRALRLFPALFVLVGFGVIFDIDGFRDRFAWHLFQASNLSFPYYGEVRPYITGHLWSLNVLEQFYLIWPIVLLALPIEFIFPVAGFLWVLIVFLRSNASHFGALDQYAWSTLAADPILMGAVTYLLCRNKAFLNTIRNRALVIASLLIIALPLFLWEGFGRSETYRLLIQPALATIVAGAFIGYGGPVGYLLENRITAFASRISYGVFMYHLLVFWLLNRYAPMFSGHKSIAKSLVLVAATLLFATASWYLIEAPIARQKRKFPVRRADAASGRSP